MADNQEAATRVVRVLRQSTKRILLPELVMEGPGRRKGTRELVEWPYIIVYKVSDDRNVVSIISVAHGASVREAL